jgi:hypothetical protein
MPSGGASLGKQSNRKEMALFHIIYLPDCLLGQIKKKNMFSVPASFLFGGRLLSFFFFFWFFFV